MINAFFCFLQHICKSVQHTDRWTLFDIYSWLIPLGKTFERKFLHYSQILISQPKTSGSNLITPFPPPKSDARLDLRANKANICSKVIRFLSQFLCYPCWCSLHTFFSCPLYFPLKNVGAQLCEQAFLPYKLRISLAKQWTLRALLKEFSP